jgi:hypothetical protein
MFLVPGLVTVSISSYGRATYNSKHDCSKIHIQLRAYVLVRCLNSFLSHHDCLTIQKGHFNLQLQLVVQ